MKKHTKSPLLIYIFLLIIIGLIFVSLSSLTEASNFGDKYSFIKKQLAWVGISTICLYLSSLVDIATIRRLSPLFYFISLVGLVLVFVPGLDHPVLGARRWIDIKISLIQPSEFLKISSILFFSHIFTKDKFKNLKYTFLYLIPPLILIILQPNLSAIILIASLVITIYYLSGAPLSSLLIFCLIGACASLILVFISPYRLARLQGLLGEEESYHNRQILLALSSGGLFGKGLANSDQKYKFLPKISTDSILAVIGEETGFLGIALIVYLYLILINYLLKLANQIPDQFSSLYLSGLATWIAYQSLINISAIVAIIPLTGVPLPFISYGGSSLLSLMIAVGLAKNIEKKYQHLLYSDNDSFTNRRPSYSRSRTGQTTKKRRHQVED